MGFWCGVVTSPLAKRTQSTHTPPQTHLNTHTPSQIHLNTHTYTHTSTLTHLLTPQHTHTYRDTTQQAHNYTDTPQHANTYRHTSTCTHLYRHTSTRTHPHTHYPTRTHLHRHTSTRTHLNRHTSKLTRLHRHTSKRIHLNVHTLTQTHLNTHTDTPHICIASLNLLSVSQQGWGEERLRCVGVIAACLTQVECVWFSVRPSNTGSTSGTKVVLIPGLSYSLLCSSQVETISHWSLRVPEASIYLLLFPLFVPPPDHVTLPWGWGPKCPSIPSKVTASVFFFLSWSARYIFLIPLADFEKCIAVIIRALFCILLWLLFLIAMQGELVKSYL